jgi:hypothetical protein
MSWVSFFSGARTDLSLVCRHALCSNVGVNAQGDKLFIAYKKIANLGHDAQGADQNGARKPHFCA